MCETLERLLQRGNDLRMNSIKHIQASIVPLSEQERDLLHRLYVKQDLSAGEIAERLSAPGAGVSERTIFSRLRAHGISKPYSDHRFKKCKYCPTCKQQMPKKTKKRS